MFGCSKCPVRSIVMTTGRYARNETLSHTKSLLTHTQLKEMTAGPLDASSNTSVCGRSLAGIAGSNPTGGNGCVCLLLSVVCCQVEVSVTDRSFVHRSTSECGVVCLSVIWEPQQSGGLGPLGLSSHEQKEMSVKLKLTL